MPTTTLARTEPALSDLGSIGRALAAGRRPGALAISRLPAPLLRWLGRSRLAPVEGNVIDLQVAAMLGLDDIFDESDLHRLSPPAARRRVEGSVIAVGLSARREVRVSEGRLDGPVCPLPYRFYEPPRAGQPSPLVVYFHGGGWVTGSPASHDGFCRWIAAEAAVRVISVAYRLAPESRFPSAVDDAVAAFRAVASRAGELSADPQRLAVMGDSAGGNLSAVVSQRTRGDAIRPALQVLLYPATDATFEHPSYATYGDRWFLTCPMIEWYYDHYVPAGVDRNTPDLSPLFVEDPAGLPKTLVYTAAFDPLVDEGRVYAERLARAGVDSRHRCFLGLPHGFALMAGAIRAGRAAVDEIARDVAQALASIP